MGSSWWWTPAIIEFKYLMIKDRTGSGSEDMEMVKESLIAWLELLSTELVSSSLLIDTITEFRYLIQAVTLLEPSEVKVQRMDISTIPGESARMLSGSSTCVTRRITESRCSRVTEHSWQSLVARETSQVSWSILTTSQSAATTESLSQILTTTEFKYLILTEPSSEHSEDGDRMMESSRDWKVSPSMLKETSLLQTEKIIVYKYFNDEVKIFLRSSHRFENHINSYLFQ